MNLSLIISIIQLILSLSVAAILLLHYFLVSKQARSLILTVISVFLSIEAVIKGSAEIKLSKICLPTLDGPITTSLVILLIAFISVDAIFRLIEIVSAVKCRRRKHRV